MAKKYKKTPKYKKIAKDWSNRKASFPMLRELVLRYIWTNPDKIEDQDLEIFLGTPRKKAKFMKFITANVSILQDVKLAPETSSYIDFVLPHVVRSAVVRFNKKSH